MREKKKKSNKSVFTPASVRLSKNTKGEKWSSNEKCDRWRVKVWTNNKRTVKEAED